MTDRNDHLFGVPMPDEIYERIFEYVGEGTVLKGNYEYCVPKAWRLINRAWEQQVSRFTFESFEYHGHPNLISRLWWILEMVVKRPDRAPMIKWLTLTTQDIHEKFEPQGQDLREIFLFTWKFGDRHFRRPRVPEQRYMSTETDDDIILYLASAYLDVRGLIKNVWRERLRDWYFRAMYRCNCAWLNPAMSGMGFDRGGDGGLQSRAQKLLQRGKAFEGYQCPLVALLIGLCPNLRGLVLHDWGADMDPWFTRVLGYSVGVHTKDYPKSELPLERLRKLHVAPHRTKPWIMSPPRTHVCEVNFDNRPYWYLPALQDFAAYQAKCVTSSGPMRLLNDSSITTQIERLTLYGPVAHDLDLPMWFRVCPRLKQFTLRLPGDSIGQPSIQEDNGVHFMASLWNMLLPYKDQLEYLDIYQEQLAAATFSKWYTDHLRNERLRSMGVKPVQGSYICPPLAEFTKLRMVCLNWFLLCGHDCYHTSPFKMRSHLPPNIESLGLYVKQILPYQEYVQGNVEEELARIMDETTITKVVVDPWLNELALAPINSHHLKNITPDVAYPLINMPDYPTEKLHDWAYRKGISADPKGERYLFYGGRRTYIGQSVSGMAGTHNQRPMWSRGVIPFGLEVFGFEGHLIDQRVTPRVYPENETPRSPPASENGNDNGNEDENADADANGNANGEGNGEGDAMSIGSVPASSAGSADVMDTGE
ncbi:hypothetical protein BDV18DRAFT_160333 [Aspergillus unguis]